jgi:glutathione S-transferase
MIKIYGQVMSRAPRCLWAAEECGVEYEHIPVNQQNGETQAPDFLSVNPNGKVPAMTDGDLTLFESMAINIHLAAHYGGALWPADNKDKSLAVQWSIWAMTEIEPPLVAMLEEKMFAEEPDQARIAAAEEQIKQPLTVLNDTMVGRDWLIGDAFSIADLNVASVLSLAGLVQFSVSEYANVDRWANAAWSRPANQKLVQQMQEVMAAAG